MSSKFCYFYSIFSNCKKKIFSNFISLLAPPSSASSANQPKTYANLFKQGNSAFSLNSDLSYNTQISPPQQQQQQPPQNNKYQPDGNPDIQGGGRDAGGRPSTGSLRRDGRDGRDGQMQRQRTNTFNDSHQLFFGNVPHRATEEELREIFAKFGRVVDLRIHTKSTAKNPSSRPLPNYGFITFEDQQSVQNCLNAMVSGFFINFYLLKERHKSVVKWGDFRGSP